MCALVLSGMTSSCKTALDLKEFRSVQPQEARVLTHLSAADLALSPDATSKMRKSFTYTYDQKQMKAFGKSMSAMRRDVCARACQETGCDVMIGPIYSIQSKNLKKGVTITMTGYPAYYTQWQKAQLSDEDLYSEMRKTSNSSQVIVKQKKGFKGLLKH
ncbi:MAG: hypothetical protein J1F06_00960 [Prevotellaceae bacterium]|nr:hypothetical protein [Prevotellaceae bacterium]